MTKQNFWLRFMLVAVPVFLLVWGLHTLDREIVLARWQDKMLAAVRDQEHDLLRDAHEVSADTLSLASDLGLRQALLDNQFEPLRSRFTTLAHYKPHYQQIRYLDETGQERVRVNTTASGQMSITPADQLQNKADRAYFREANQLPAGSLRLSHLDLNEEHGKIEQPLNPILRFSSPLFDVHGKRRGVIVINYAMNPLLAIFDHSLGAETGHLMLLNATGAWLAGGDPQQRWGDILPKHTRRLSTEQPELWQQLMAKLAHGEQAWESGGAIYAQATLFPAEFVRQAIGEVPVSVSSADPWWMLLSQAPLREVEAVSNQRLYVMVAAALLGLGLWGFAIFVWRNLKQQTHTEQRRAARLAQVVEQTSDVVMITDQKGLIDYINPAFSQVTGYHAEEVQGKTPALLKSGQHSEAFYQTLWAEIKAGRAFQDLFINRRRDGTHFYSEQTISPLLDEHGKVASFVSTGKDITDSKVTKLAFYDPLTGLANRVLFLDRLEHEMAHANRTGQPIALLYMDLDGFKLINDTLGHSAGDEVLKEFARRISTLMRRSDTFARLSGDEFVILLREINHESEAVLFASKVIERVTGTWHIGSASVDVGVSIGISLYPADTPGPDNVLARADIAMYAAKRGGKNRYEVYHAV